MLTVIVAHMLVLVLIVLEHSHTCTNVRTYVLDYFTKSSAFMNVTSQECIAHISDGWGKCPLPLTIFLITYASVHTANM